MAADPGCLPNPLILPSAAVCKNPVLCWNTPTTRLDPVPPALLLLLARLTDRQLAGVVQYLKAENEILRGRLPKRVTVTPQEKQRLHKFGRPLGPRIKDVVSILTRRTCCGGPTGTGRGPGQPPRASRAVLALPRTSAS